MGSVKNVISNLNASLAALRELQAGGPTREKAVAITDLEKVIAYLEYFNR